MKTNAKILFRAIIIAAFVQADLQHACGQSANWIWAKGATGSGFQEGYHIAIDPSGNLFLTGVFDATITFGTTVLTNNGQEDIFIAKYDGNGNELWARSAGGSAYDRAANSCTDGNGNLYITGYFNSPSITFGSTVLTNNGGYDLFLVKYDGNGNVVWAKSAGGSGAEGGSVKTDASGNVYLSGSFSSPSLTFGSVTLTNIGLNDIFLVKYDSNGNVTWAKSAGTSGDEGGSGVSIDQDGKVYINGSFQSPSLTLGTTTLVNNGDNDIFLAKYDSSGNVLWAKSAGGANDEFAGGVANDDAGNVCFTGGFASPAITFGTTTLVNWSASGDSMDVLVAKYDSAGNVLWAKSGTGGRFDLGFGIATDNNNNVYVSGGSSSLAITFNSTTLSPPGNCLPQCDPMFIVKYDPVGNVVCSDELDSGGDDQNAITTDAFGNAYIGGDFRVNPFVLGIQTLWLTGSENAFAAKFSCGPQSVNEQTGNTGIKLFPDPAHTSLNIILYKPCDITIMNILGNVLQDRKYISYTGEKMELDISSLSPGIYFLKAGSEVRKFVKE